jgi:hypothetical protein
MMKILISNFIIQLITTAQVCHSFSFHHHDQSHAHHLSGVGRFAAKFTKLSSSLSVVNRRNHFCKRLAAKRVRTFFPPSCNGERYIIVGDVHGCIDELLMLLAKCKFYPESDRLIFVGDLVAKGPDSLGCLRLASDLNASSVIGNHEVKVLNLARSLSSVRSGQVCNLEHSEHALIAASLLEEANSALFRYIQSFQQWIALYSGSVLVVHAGLLPSTTPDQNDLTSLTTMRSISNENGVLKSSAYPGQEPWAKFWTGPQTVVFGHDAARGLQVSRL